MLALDTITYPNNNGGAAVTNFNYYQNDPAVTKRPPVSMLQPNGQCPI